MSQSGWWGKPLYSLNISAPSEYTSAVGKPIFNVPTRKVSFASWPVLNIAAEEENEVTVRRRIYLTTDLMSERHTAANWQLIPGVYFLSRKSF